MESIEQSGSLAENIVSELLPEDLDWIRLVRTYPLTSVVLAGLGGFLIGRRHGPKIYSAVSSFAADRVTRNVSQVIERAVP